MYEMSIPKILINKITKLFGIKDQKSRAIISTEEHGFEGKNTNVKMLSTFNIKKIRSWYIKKWYVVGIAWFLSLFILIKLIRRFIPITVPENFFNVFYFPIFFLDLVFRGLDVGYFGYLLMFISFLIPCYILAVILKLVPEEGK